MAAVLSTLSPGSTLFGTRNRTAALVAIRLLETTYPAELAALLGVRPFTVHQILRGLEQEQAIAIRTVGRTRVVALNPRYAGHASLASLLWELGVNDPELQRRLASVRRRPRRAGKPGL